MLLYPRLAASNIRKNGKMYLPYIITSSVMIMMFYIILSLSSNKNYEGTTTGYYLGTILTLGAAVIGIFSLLFLFYTNSFLIRKRKKEFGLYNILGMEKRHIFTIMLFESIYLFLITLIIGLVFGIAFNKLCFLLLQRLIGSGLLPEFEISLSAIVVTIVLFLAIFLVTLAYNLFNIQTANPIQLLKGDNEGEKEPKTQWLSVIIGFAALAGGYYIANTVEKPLEALTLFFVAVILVIIGTYNLFLAGSVLLLKLMRRNKKYYYQTRHFISVSSMIYRMKQNAAGLASICILATAVLVMISGTLSLYLGMGDALKTRVQSGIVINGRAEEAEKIVAAAHEAQSKEGATLKKEVAYSYFSLWGEQQGEQFEYIPLTDENNNATTIINLLVVPLEDYNKTSGSNFQLEDGEILLGTDSATYEKDTIIIYGTPLNVEGRVEFGFRPDNVYIGNGARYLAVVKDVDTLNALHRAFVEHPLNTAPSKYRILSESQIMFYYAFDLSNPEAEVDVYMNMLDNARRDGLSISIESREVRKTEMMEMYGGFLFLGLFLSVLFIIATTLIIYYKQITEGYDDRARYSIMLKVGLSDKEIKETIRSQILLTFFLPLITASIHIIAAFKVIQLLLNLLFLYNSTLFALCTIGTILAFSLAYLLIYRGTSRVYYNIVSDIK